MHEAAPRQKNFQIILFYSILIVSDSVTVPTTFPWDSFLLFPGVGVGCIHLRVPSAASTTAIPGENTRRYSSLAKAGMSPTRQSPPAGSG